MSLKLLAKEMGISKGTLFHYYPSKGDLIFEISDRYMKNVTEKIIKWLEVSGKMHSSSMILELVFKMLLSSESSGYIHIYLIHEILIGNKKIKQRFYATYEKWTALLIKGIEQVLGDDKNYRDLARLIICTLDGILIQKLLQLPNIKETTNEIVNYLSSMPTNIKTPSNT